MREFKLIIAYLVVSIWTGVVVYALWGLTNPNVFLPDLIINSGITNRGVIYYFICMGLSGWAFYTILLDDHQPKK